MSSQAVLASHICRATFAYRTFPCQGQIFPHQTFAYHKINRHLPIQTFAYQFRFECSRHVPIRNSTQGTFAYQTIAYQKGIENLKKQTFANLKLFIRRDIRLSDNYLSIASIRKMSWKLSFKLSQLLLVLDLQCWQMWRQIANTLSKSRGWDMKKIAGEIRACHESALVKSFETSSNMI